MKRRQKRARGLTLSARAKAIRDAETAGFEYGHRRAKAMHPAPKDPGLSEDQARYVLGRGASKGQLQAFLRGANEGYTGARELFRSQDSDRE